jgi:hypothetical protein
MDNLFSNSHVLIPAGLRKAILSEGFRPERQTAMFLTYDVIVQQCSGSKGEWTSICDFAFENVVRNNTRKSEAKAWLFKKGFIDIKQWRATDGTLYNSKIPGIKCQAYKVIEQNEESMWVPLWKRNVIWSAVTPNDPLCQYTRTVLGAIQVDHSEVGRMWRGENEFSTLPHPRRNAIVRCARTLDNAAGTIKRGRQVSRLYSPWTCAPRELRKVCTLSGEPIVSIDLQASQLALIGVLARDDDFSHACVNDDLYRHVMTSRGVCRDEAKETVLSYVYGNNRTARSRNEGALHVQEYVANAFPKTHAFIWDSKIRSYNAFSQQLQNLEADLFLGGIFQQMIELRMSALTVHDSVAVPNSQEERALDIIREVLGEKLRGKARLKIEKYGKEVDEYVVEI